MCDDGGGNRGGGGGADECHIEPTCGAVCLAYLCAAAGLRVIPFLLGVGEDATTATGKLNVDMIFFLGL